MKTVPVILFAVLLAGAGAFAVRSRTLRALETRVADLRRSVESLPAAGTVQPPGPSAPDRHSILRALREVRPGNEGDPKKMEAVLKDLESLPLEDLRLLLREAAAVRPAPEGFPELVAGLAGSMLAERDPSAAMTLLAGLPPGFARDNMIPKTLASWLKNDPGGAAAWIRRALTDGSLMDFKDRGHLPMMAALGEIMAAPAESLGRIRGEPEEMQISLLHSAVRMLKKPEDARAVAAAIIAWPVQGVRERLLSEAAGRLLELDSFAAAAAWLDALPEPSPAQRDEARLALALGDAPEEEASKRAAWMLASATPEARPSLAARLAGGWAGRDHDAAGRWLNASRAAPWYDAAARGFADTVSRKDPATAFDWSLTITGETIRRDALRAVMRRWSRDNPGAAADYVRKSALPAEWIAELAGDSGGEAGTDGAPAGGDHAAQ